MWVCATGARHSKSLERRCPRTACLRRGPKIIYSYYTRCALIRDRQPTAWDGFPRPAETEATCIWKVSPQIVVESIDFKSTYMYTKWVGLNIAYGNYTFNIIIIPYCAQLFKKTFQNIKMNLIYSIKFTIYN